MNMNFWIFFFRSLSPYPDYFMLLLPLCAIYLVIIHPALIRFWIIPKIERRYKTKLVFDIPIYKNLFFGASWFWPAGTMITYICLSYLGFEKMFKNSNYALKKINYDINSASRAEIIVSFIGGISFLLAVVSCIVVVLH